MHGPRETRMLEARTGLIESLIQECQEQGITDPKKIAEYVSGHYTVEESCTQKYSEILGLVTPVHQE